MLYSYVSFLFLAHKGDIDVARRRVDSTWTLSIEEQRGSFLSTVTFTRFVLYSSLCLSLSLSRVYHSSCSLSLCCAVSRRITLSLLVLSRASKLRKCSRYAQSPPLHFSTSSPSFDTLYSTLTLTFFSRHSLNHQTSSFPRLTAFSKKPSPRPTQHLD